MAAFVFSFVIFSAFAASSGKNKVKVFVNFEMNLLLQFIISLVLQLQPIACANQGWATACCRKPSITLAETELIARQSSQLGGVSIQTPSKITAVTLLIAIIRWNLYLVQPVIFKGVLLFPKLAPQVTNFSILTSFFFFLIVQPLFPYIFGWFSLKQR